MKPPKLSNDDCVTYRRLSRLYWQECLKANFRPLVLRAKWARSGHIAECPKCKAHFAEMKILAREAGMRMEE